MSSALVKRFDVAGKIGLVTGAGKGIGRGVALTLAEAGMSLAVQDLDPKAAGSVAEEIIGAGGKALPITGDASDQASVEDSFVRTKQEFGRLDVLVNNAGIYPYNEILDMPVEEWDTVLGLNLRGTFLHTKFGAQLMVDGGNGGRIINIASVKSFRPSDPGFSHYDVSKSGVVMLTQAAALEFAKHRIHINSVAPGVVETDGTRDMIKEGAFGDPSDIVPLGRWAQPSDIGDAVLFLAGPAASYITGATLVVDGGSLVK